MVQFISGRHVSALIVSTAVVWVACAGTPPPPARGVLENDISSWKFRRYQLVQEVEVWVAENPAVAHTASYVRGQAEKSGRIGDKDLVNAFVTRYDHDRGVMRAAIVFVRRLAQESGYKIDEEKREGVPVIAIRGHDESWVLWPARRHVVKLGGRYLGDVPGALIDAYGERYPSRLSSGMLDGPLPPVEDKKRNGDGENENDEYDPDNPAPDWKKYQQGDIQPRDGARD